MSGKDINELQASDAEGNPVLNANSPVAINGSGTVTLFTGTGVFLGITIWDEIADGTFYFTDGDDADIAGLPDDTHLGTLDYAGAFAVPRLELTNGLKIVTADATGLVGTGWVFKNKG